MADTPIKPRRRWLRFSLRTLFVAVTAVACWLAYYVHWKNARSEARAWMHAQGIGGSIGYPREPHSAMPWMLGLLGDHPEDVLIIEHVPSQDQGAQAPPEYRALVGRLVALFPEAHLVDLSAADWVTADTEEANFNDASERDSPAAQVDQP